MYAARLLGCEGEGNASVGPGGGVAAYMDGTRGSGVLSSTCDVIEMSVVRGVGGVCGHVYVFGRCWGEWVTGLGLGFTNSEGTMEKMGYVSVFWLRWCGWCWERVGGRLGPESGKVGWCNVCVCCESGVYVLMAGPGICILC